MSLNLKALLVLNYSSSGWTVLDTSQGPALWIPELEESWPEFMEKSLEPTARGMIQRFQNKPMEKREYRHRHGSLLPLDWLQPNLERELEEFSRKHVKE
jgi:hypothetical protein